MKAMKEKIIEKDVNYKIYKSGKYYFLDTYKGISYGYKTLTGAKESAYYQGYREKKD